MDLFHQEKKESTKSLALVNESGSFQDELESWKEKVTKIKNDMLKLERGYCEFKRMNEINDLLVPVGYGLLFYVGSNVFLSIKITFLKSKVGKIFTKPVSEKNYKEARLAVPLVTIRFRDNVDNRLKKDKQITSVLKAYFQKERYKVI